MLIPKFWSQATARTPSPRQGPRAEVSVHRWGWSNDSPAQAHAHAQRRLARAIEGLRRGESVRLRERQHAYDVGEGVPIREEVVLTEGCTVVTRNVYGALCLNTPDVMFVDIDDQRPHQPIIQGFRSGLAALAGCLFASVACALSGASAPAAALSLIAPGAFLLTTLCSRRRWRAHQPDPRQASWDRVRSFAANHGDWHLRVYETPAGLRVLVMNDTFSAATELCARIFGEFGTDPRYQRLCRMQRCFRARVSPKPWRLATFAAGRPPRKTWPLDERTAAARDAWVENYEKAAEPYASCRFIQTYGPSHTSPRALEVQRLHDRLSRALEDLPLA